MSAEKINDLLDYRACLSHNTLTLMVIYDSIFGIIIPQTVNFAFAVYFIHYIRQSKRQIQVLKTNKRNTENNHSEASYNRNAVSIARSNSIVGPSVGDKDDNNKKSNIAESTADNCSQGIASSNNVLVIVISYSCKLKLRYVKDKIVYDYVKENYL